MQQRVLSTERTALATLMLSAFLAACGGSADPTAEVTATGAAPASAAPTDAAAVAWEWAECANENEVCRLGGTYRVRYGGNGTFTSGTFKGNVTCSNAVFGDPVPGLRKRCEMLRPTSASANPPLALAPTPAPAPSPAAAPGPAPGPAPVGSPTPASAPASPPAAAPAPTPAPSAAPTPAPTPAPSPTPSPAPAPAPAPAAVASTGAMPTPETIAGKTRVSAIVARDGQVIENVHVTNPNGSCIVVNGVSNVVIRDSEIGPCGTEGNPNAQGIEISNSTRITIERNVIHDVSSAVYAVDSRHPIVMERNYVYNVRGPFPRGQMIQMNRVTGGTAPSRVACNLSDAMPGRRYGVDHGVTNAGVEDHINLFESPGLPNGRTELSYNRLRGGHKTSRSGSGIMMGDYGGGGVTARGNVVVNVANVGIGIAGGRDITLEDNVIYQNRDAGIYVNLGIMVWNVAGPTCPGNHAVNGNRVWTFNSLGAQNAFWNAGNCGPVAMSGNTFGDASLTESVFDQVPPACR